MWNPAAAFLERKPEPFPYFILTPFLLGCLKQPPKAPCLTPERNLLVPDPLNIPQKICSCLFRTCLLSQTILTRTMGGPGFPHSERLGVHRNTLSCCHCQPLEEAQAYGQVLSAFWKSNGTLTTWGLFVFTWKFPQPPWAFPSCSHSFFSSSGCVFGNIELLSIFL